MWVKELSIASIHLYSYKYFVRDLRGVIFLATQVKRHAALVLGNISQTDQHRAAAGIGGAVEALLSICDSNDSVGRANALWALSNLAWDPQNQVSMTTVLDETLNIFFSQIVPRTRLSYSCTRRPDYTTIRAELSHI